MGYSSLAVVQFLITYFPAYYKGDYEYKTLPSNIERHDAYQIITGEFDGFIPAIPEERWSEDECFTNVKPYITTKPIIAWKLISISGFSNNAEATCGLDYEWQAIGKDMLEYIGEQIRELSLPYFQTHPNLHKRYKGTNISIRGLSIENKYINIDEYKEPLDIHLPTLWSYWYSYDDYNNEMDTDFNMEGVLDTNRLQLALKKDAESGHNN